MYPKVKVREDRDEDHKRDVAVDHKVFASLPIRVSSSSPPGMILNFQIILFCSLNHIIIYIEFERELFVLLCLP